MKNDYETGKNAAAIESLKDAVKELDGRMDAREKRDTIMDVSIAKCTALGGFCIMIATAIGGFISYNFVRVKLAILAALKAFYGN